MRRIEKLDINDFREKLPIELILETKINELVSFLNKELRMKIDRLELEVKFLREKNKGKTLKDLEDEYLETLGNPHKGLQEQLERIQETLESIDEGIYKIKP